ncbi:MAG: serpin family protein [Bacteroidales bacterium]|nr:serpin family protein [Bacteroidales bacterium]
MKNTVICLILLGFMSVSCQKKENGENNLPDPINVNFTAKEKKLAESDNHFGIEFFKELNSKEEAGKNIMVSPLSVALVLAMIYNGADTDTKTAMEKALLLEGMTREEINNSYKGLISKLQSLDPKVLFGIANSIWYRDDFPVLQEFINTNKTYYNAEVTALDFNNPSSVNIINNWVASKTNNKINKIIDEITAENIMFLINAIYFKGIWKYQFEKKNTKPYPFHLADKTVKNVDMMEQKADFMVYNDKIFRAVELPYGKGQYSMLVLVPTEDYTVEDIISQLTNENWTKWCNNLTPIEKMIVVLPKFKFKYEKKLNEVLIKMGMGIAFDNNADFSKINPDADLFISKVLHKTYIDVDEEGTEAAAVTVIVVNTTSTLDNYFIADRPFLFVIKEKNTNAMLFMGKVMEPKYE